MKIAIRPAELGDISITLSFLDLLSKTKSDKKTASKIFKKFLRSGNYFLFVAEIENRIVGTASIFIVPSLQHGRPWGYIDNVVVDKNFRKKGIGKKLGEVLINFAKEKNCYKIVLTSRFSRPGIHQFWQKLDFKKHGFSFRRDL